VRVFLNGVYGRTEMWRVSCMGGYSKCFTLLVGKGRISAIV
jgi:hypothetical protein